MPSPTGEKQACAMLPFVLRHCNANRPPQDTNTATLAVQRERGARPWSAEHASVAFSGLLTSALLRLQEEPMDPLKTAAHRAQQVQRFAVLPLSVATTKACAACTWTRILLRYAMHNH